MVQLIKLHYSSSSMDNSDVIIITHQHPVTALRFHQCKIIIDRWNNSARTVVETGHTRKNNVRVLRTDNCSTVVSINVVHLHLGPMEGLLPLRRSLIDNATTCTSKNQNLFILSSSMIHLVTKLPTATMMTTGYRIRFHSKHVFYSTIALHSVREQSTHNLSCWFWRNSKPIVSRRL